MQRTHGMTVSRDGRGAARSMGCCGTPALLRIAAVWALALLPMGSIIFVACRCAVMTSLSLGRHHCTWLAVSLSHALAV
jgi:hypothetical protein